jgi:hypothetical protein
VAETLQAQQDRRSGWYREVAGLVLDVDRRPAAALADEITAWLTGPA